MKRHICAAAGALVLALAGAGTATASGLPLVGEPIDLQSASLGDQSVGEQKNDADVTQEQGNGNLNVSPAISILGDASTWNAQGNDNTALAGVEQSNEASQSQTVEQEQGTEHDSGCCGGQEATQVAEGGDQSVGEQKNDADATQEQGNGNVNVSPAIAILGDASTSNEQGNGNTAVAVVDQANAVDQSQDVTQTQSASGGDGCCGGRSQDATQVADLGDQSVEKQKNEADVTQSQGNGNVNVSPAIALGGDASTSNEQGNGNTAVAVVDQANAVDQSQDVTQTQSASGGDGCCGGRSQDATQVADLGDQSVGEQKNDADVTQEQGNGNVNVAPAIAIGGRKLDSCKWSCSGHSRPAATTENAQGNGNKAVALVEQDNSVTQTQDVRQTQTLPSEVCCTEHHRCAPYHCEHETQPEHHPCAPYHCTHEPEHHPCAPYHCEHTPQPKHHCDVHPCHSAHCEHHPKHHCCDGQSQTGEQKVTGGDQSVQKQKNEADVSQQQGNENEGFSPAFASHGSNASTSNAQGNGNTAVAAVSQRNAATQSQTTSQRQGVVGGCKEVIRW